MAIPLCWAADGRPREMVEDDRTVDVARAFERLPGTEAIRISSGGKRYASASTTQVVALANASGRINFFDNLGGWAVARFGAGAVVREGGSTDWVAASPAAGEVGLVVTDGVLEMVLGSTAARKIGWLGLVVKFDAIVYTGDAAWQILVTDDSGTPGAFSGVGEWSSGPVASPRGSIHLSVPDGDQSVQLRTSAFNGTKISDITKLGYWTYAETWNGNQLPYLTIYVNLSGDPEGTPTDRIIFEPYFSTVESGLGGQPNVSAGAWQHWDVHGGNCYCDSTAGYLTLAAYGAANPDAVIVNQDGSRWGFRLASGFCSPTDEFSTYIDLIELNDLTFDFEPG